MACWKLQLYDTKANVATALSSATIAEALCTDAPASDLTADSVAIAQLAAAVTAAQAQLAALNGAAPKAKAILIGYHDPSTTAPIPYGAASYIDVRVTEFWG